MIKTGKYLFYSSKFGFTSDCPQDLTFLGGGCMFGCVLPWCFLACIQLLLPQYFLQTHTSCSSSSAAVLFLISYADVQKQTTRGQQRATSCSVKIHEGKMLSYCKCSEKYHDKCAVFTKKLCIFKIRKCWLKQIT